MADNRSDSSDRVDVDCNCCNCSSKTTGRLFVSFVSFLIFSVWFTWWVSYAYPWMVWGTNFGIFHCLFFNSAVFLATLCYYKSVTTPPGFANSGYVSSFTSSFELAFFSRCFSFLFFSFLFSVFIFSFSSLSLFSSLHLSFSFLFPVLFSLCF